jgi:hypothetical protein
MIYFKIDTIDKILQSEHPRRPAFTDSESCNDIAALAKQCWSDPPVDRPPFHEIKKLIKIAKRKR